MILACHCSILIAVPYLSGKPLVGDWRSLVAHLVWVQGVAGSNPASPTIFLIFKQVINHASDDNRQPGQITGAIPA